MILAIEPQKVSSDKCVEELAEFVGELEICVRQNENEAITHH